jgi:putative membrane protein
MSGWILAHYNLWRGIHIIFVIAWMAGQLYLPRLFAYHVKATPGSEMDLTFQTMELKLLKIIMNPAMVLAFIFGCILMYVRGVESHGAVFKEPWMITKLVGVVFMVSWHGFLARARKKFATGTNTHSEKFWRATNELPFLVAIVMVLAVTTEFGSGG